MSSTPAIEARIEDLSHLSIVRSKARISEPRRFPRRLILAGALAAGSAVLWFGAGKVTAARPVTVQTAPAEELRSDSASAVLSGSGYVVTDHSYVTVGTLISGQIVAEPIEEGQHVKRGDLIAQIGDSDYRAHLGEANADYARAVAESALADQRAERMKQLYSEGVTLRDEYDSLMSSQRVSHAALARAKATVAYAASQVRQCAIRSPLNGVVLRKFRDQGSTINYSVELQSEGGSTDIAMLADTDNLRVELDVSESDISKVHVGMPASISLDAYPDRSFEAKVVKIYPEANRQKGSIKVEVLLLHPDPTLIRPEMSAKVNFLDKPAHTGSDAPIVTVPKAALFKSADGAPFVWIVNDGRAEKTPVETGRQVADNVQIQHGLSGSETVVVEPGAKLVDGQAVIEKSDTGQ